MPNNVFCDLLLFVKLTTTILVSYDELFCLLCTVLRKVVKVVLYVDDISIIGKVDFGFYCFEPKFKFCFVTLVLVKIVLISIVI